MQQRLLFLTVMASYVTAEHLVGQHLFSTYKNQKLWEISEIAKHCAKFVHNKGGWHHLPQGVLDQGPIEHLHQHPEHNKPRHFPKVA